MAQDNKPSTSFYKLVFFALLESASRYREAYFRDEITAFEEAAWKEFEYQKKYVLKTHTQVRKAEMFASDAIATLRAKLAIFNEAMDKELKTITAQFTDTGLKNFDNYATAYGLMAEELQKAKNTTDLLTICRLYNQGTFDKILADARAMKDNLNQQYEKNENKNPIPDNPIPADTGRMQETDTSAIIPGYNDPHPADQPG